MKRVLIVAPHFPPVNAADMHRVRVSLPHFEAFGWTPHVLTVSAHCQEMPVEPRLMDTVPRGVPITATRAFSPRWTRRLGIGSVALRAFPHLYRAGRDLIRRESIDLVFFSTTAFPVMALGRIWKRQLGVPYVLDIQDAWLSEYYDDKPASSRPPKYAMARALHAVLEPYTMRAVDGLVAVSPAYLQTLRKRYPWISADMCRTVPFGAADDDFRVAASQPWQNPVFDPADGHVHLVSVGRGGDDMRLAATILFRAVKQITTPRVRASFVGTDYAHSRRTIAPVAESEGIGSLVTEQPARVPYFDGLRLLRDAHAIVILRSDDPDYSPSKVYPCILARRPIVAVMHASNPAADLVARMEAGIVVRFEGPADVERAVAELAGQLAALLPRLPFEPTVDWRAFEPFSAREVTREQCELFDASVAHRTITAGVPCLG